MANEGKASTGVLSTEEFVKQLATAFRESSKDPEAEARKEAQRLRTRAEQTRAAKVRAAIEANCAHMREDNTSAIAWMTFSDNVVRGTCQRCAAVFKEDHPDYHRLLRIPTRQAGVIYF